jgi:hypothetical protein
MASARFFHFTAMASLVAFAAAVHATEPEVLGGHEGWLDRMGGGIRELGMGNTGTALEDAQPAAYWNPALLPFNRETLVGVGADIRSLDRNGGFASMQGRVAANMGMGIGLLNRGDFNVEAYDADERPIGTAQPQSIATFVGMGVRTSRSNAFGAALQWYSTNLDIDNAAGNVNVIGILTLGWYKRWNDRLKTGVVIRNLGINPDLSANFDQTVLSAEGSEISGFERTSTDFFPKTLIVAGLYTVDAWKRKFDLAAEVMDYQLKDELYSVDANFHTQDFRLGVDCHWNEAMSLRGGYDRGNLSLGFGYMLPWGRRRIMFDYAFLLERGWLTLNPYAVGLRFAI